MRYGRAVSLVLLVWCAFAGEPGSAVTSPGSRAAEYQRLSEEMDRAAKRTNWVAVERLFASLEAMGQPHTFTVFVQAAQAARGQGDTATAKARLLKAAAIREDREVLDWLWQIQKEYGPVMLAADLPANYRLTTEAMPFNPEHRKSVEYAQNQVIEASMFDGLIPRGSYRFAPYRVEADSLVFDFEVRENPRRIDIRTKDEPTRADRKKRERIDRRIAREAASAG